jgi:hypothetical protein
MKFTYLEFDCHKNYYRLYITNLLSVGLKNKCVAGCNVQKANAVISSGLFTLKITDNAGHH